MAYLQKNYELVITSEPATYSTNGEMEFKNAIYDKVLSEIPSNINGVNLSFSVSSNTRKGHKFDLDNLCEPVFSSLCRAGWFNGKRPSIKWWYAERKVSQPSGVTISSVFPELDRRYKRTLSAKYKGPLPRNSRDELFIEWIKEVIHQLDINTTMKSFGLRLQFGDDMLNIGDISTGRVKNVIDCLYPLVGGEIGKPDDWKIEKLLVEKGKTELSKDELRIDVFVLD